MSAIENKFASVMPPVAGSVMAKAHSATASRHEVPPSWKRNIVTFYSQSSTLFLLLGDAGVVADAAEVGLTATETTAASWATGIPIPAGTYLNVSFPSEITHFSVDSDAASGNWYAWPSSGGPALLGEELPPTINNPAYWLDAGIYSSITQSSSVVSEWRGRLGGFVFSEASSRPDYVSAIGAASLTRPAVKFTSANSDRLECTDSRLAALVGSTSAWTAAFAFSRAATGAAHTLLSVGTTGSNNGRWDLTLDASDDFVMTRVTSGGSSSTSTYTTNVGTGTHFVVVTFDGTTPLLWLDRTSQALTGTATGDVGTVSRVAIGCRSYNTSTRDQFLGGEISDAMLWSRALSTQEVSDLHGWLKRRYGV